MAQLPTAAFLALALAASAAAAELSNVVPRTSTDGAIMDAHDGNVLRINSTYFWCVWAADRAPPLRATLAYLAGRALPPRAALTYLALRASPLPTSPAARRRRYAAGYGLCVERNGPNGCSGGFTGCGFLHNHTVRARVPRLRLSGRGRVVGRG